MNAIERAFRRPNRGSFQILFQLHAIELLRRWKYRDARYKGRDICFKFIKKKGIGAEIGVWRGDYSQTLLDNLEPSTLYLIDPWPSVTEGETFCYPLNKDGVAYGVDGEEMKSLADADGLYEYVIDRFRRVDGVHVLRCTSQEALVRIEDASLDWIHLDGLHYYENVLEDLAGWEQKLRCGGIVIGDDYYWKDGQDNYSVKKAVDEFVKKSNKLRSFYVFRGKYVLFY